MNLPLIELIVKGTIIGLFLFCAAKWIYWTGYKHALEWVQATMEKNKQKSEKVSK